MPRRKRKSTSEPVHSPSHAPADDTHFRLCHFCYYLNESAEEILACRHCERTLADTRGGRDPFELNEGEQAWADPAAGIIRAQDLADESEDSDSGREEEGEDDDGAMYGRRRLPRLAGLSVVW